MARRGIVVWNGWGMDAQALPLAARAQDAVYLVSYPDTFDVSPDACTEWIAIGWSFGAYRMAQWMSSHPTWSWTCVIGINGHPDPVGRYGITPKLFAKTVTELSPATLPAFYRNMELPTHAVPRTRSWDSIREELESVYRDYQVAPIAIDVLVTGGRDRIIPAKGQLRYAETHGCASLLLPEEGHYPFARWDSWSSLLDEVLACRRGHGG